MNNRHGETGSSRGSHSSSSNPTHADLDVWRVKNDSLWVANQELERLRKIITDAPHDIECPRAHVPWVKCDCWKSKVDE